MALLIIQLNTLHRILESTHFVDQLIKFEFFFLFLYIFRQWIAHLQIVYHFSGKY